ncbi:MAG TPA: hypothetical protein VGH51_05260 [Candidatus Angelobacter sp.]|jgi:hypothetical protein
MHADFSVELGRDDPALELPWRSDDPQVRYYDLKSHPELVLQIPEAAAYPPLSAFLTRINAPGFPLATAKCDAWHSSEVEPEEEIFGDRKFVSYIDLVFEDESIRCSLEKHEAFARELCRLLGHAPEIAATVELVIRRCYYHQTRGAEHGETAEDGSRGEVRDGDDRPRAKLRDGDGLQTTEEDGPLGKVRDGDGLQTTELGNGMLGNAEEPTEAADAEHQLRSGAEERARGGREMAGKDEERPKAVGAGDRLRGEAEERARGEERLETEGAGDRLRGEAEERARGEERLETEGRAPRLEELAKADLPDKTREDDGRLLRGPDVSTSGFCLTAYVSGFGDDDHEPGRRWEVALILLQNAVVQLARTCG